MIIQFNQDNGGKTYYKLESDGWWFSSSSNRDWDKSGFDDDTTFAEIIKIMGQFYQYGGIYLVERVI